MGDVRGSSGRLLRYGDMKMQLKHRYAWFCYILLMIFHYSSKVDLKIMFGSIEFHASDTTVSSPEKVYAVMSKQNMIDYLRRLELN